MGILGVAAVEYKLELYVLQNIATARDTGGIHQHMFQSKCFIHTEWFRERAIGMPGAGQLECSSLTGDLLVGNRLRRATKLKRSLNV
jgi:hypothetical protein